MYIKFERSLNDPIFCCTLWLAGIKRRNYTCKWKRVFCAWWREVCWFIPLVYQWCIVDINQPRATHATAQSHDAVLTTRLIIVRCGLSSFAYQSGRLAGNTRYIRFHLQINLLLSMIFSSLIFGRERRGVIHISGCKVAPSTLPLVSVAPHRLLYGVESSRW